MAEDINSVTLYKKTYETLKQQGTSLITKDNQLLTLTNTVSLLRMFLWIVTIVWVLTILFIVFYIFRDKGFSMSLLGGSNDY